MSSDKCPILTWHIQKLCLLSPLSALVTQWCHHWGFCIRNILELCLIFRIKTSELFYSPFSAHVKKKYIESSLLLLHPSQYTLHTQTVLGGVWRRSINGNHETVAIVFIPMASKVQQTCGRMKNDWPLQYRNSARLHTLWWHYNLV